MINRTIQRDERNATCVACVSIKSHALHACTFNQLIITHMSNRNRKRIVNATNAIVTTTNDTPPALIQRDDTTTNNNAIVVVATRVESNDTTTNATTNDDTTQRVDVSRVFNVRDARDDARIDELLSQLQNANRAQSKRIRRELRSLNHFGGTRERSSRYYDANRDAIRVNRVVERERRINARRDALRDIDNDDND